MFSSSTVCRSAASANMLPRLRPQTASRRCVMALADHKYTAHATAGGSGHNRTVKTDNLELRWGMPASFGGSPDTQNAGQLLAMGYSVCFLNALRSVAGQTGERAEAARNAKVHAQVHMGKPKDLPGFGIAVELKVEGIKDRDLINAAHQACPYSRAILHGADIRVSSS